MTDRSSLEATLQAHLPTHLQHVTPSLAQLLTNLRDGATSREETREVITQDQQLQAAINALSGTVIEQSTSSISFGHDSSFGDITIKGGAAGRDIVNLSFSWAPPQKQVMDNDMLARRRSAYTELWRILKPFARYDLPTPITPAVLKQVTVQMRDWYFDIGGLLLSEHCRIPYFEFKDMLMEYLSNPNRPADAPFDEAAVHELIEEASRLRASLRKDIEGSASS